MNPYGILAALAVVGVVGWQGYRMGVNACEARQNAELLAQIEAGEKLEADRIRLKQQRDALARKNEELANADPVLVERCLSPDRMRRLNSLR